MFLMLKIPESERQELERLAQDPSAGARMAQRARIVLLSAGGYALAEIAARVGCSEPTVVRWRRRYAERGVAGLQDRPRAGRPPRLGEAKRSEILLRTVAPPPPGSAVTHWSSRLLARRAGVHHSTVARLWREYGLQPRPGGMFRFSTNPRLEAKVRDIAGLYLCPPDHAVVLDVDDRAPIQAPDQGRPNDGATLFTALEEAMTSMVAGAGNTARDHLEFLTFLRRLARAYPRVELRIVCDNDALQTRPGIAAWLARHPSITLHVAQTTSSWRKLLKVFLSIIIFRAVDRDGFDLAHDVIHRFIDACDQHHEPYVWIKAARTTTASSPKSVP